MDGNIESTDIMSANRNDMTTHRKPSAILRAIGERIGKPEAWTQKAYARHPNGAPSSGPYVDAACWCWHGALYCTDATSFERSEAVRFMQTASCSLNIAEFNDTHTHAEVLAANARAVELAEADGQ